MPDHAHGESTALVMPLSGELLIASGQHQEQVTQGVVVLLDHRERVRLANETNEPVTLLAVFAPAGFVRALSSWPATTTTAASTGTSGRGGDGAAWAEVHRQVVEQATHASSVHNTQPWRFASYAEGLDLYADSARQLPVLDPRGRQLHLSCGAALLHAQVAARARGLTAEPQLLPDPADPAHLARLRLTSGKRAGARGRRRDRAAAHLPGRLQHRTAARRAARTTPTGRRGSGRLPARPDAPQRPARAAEPAVAGRHRRASRPGLPAGAGRLGAHRAGRRRHPPRSAAR